MARIAAVWISVVLAMMPLAACPAHRQGGKNMDEQLTGRSMTIQEAAGAADQIVVVRLTNWGQADVGAPGQAYYDNATAEVVRWLKGEPPFDRRPRMVSFAYTVQSLPAEAREEVPAAGRNYILFLSARAGSTMRAIKILPADEKLVNEVLHAAGSR